MSCPKCGEDAPADAKYCENCGLNLTAAVAPAPARVPLERDRVEIALGADLAAVTDRGLRHPVNEDDVALALQGGSQAIVVCDGVSSSQDAAVASRAAAGAARDVLAQAGAEGDPQDALIAAVGAAHAAACAVPFGADGPKEPPGTTLVAALVRDGVASVAWVGDSRAYWLGPSGAGLLTRDHSWVNEVVDAGRMTEAEALRSRQAHAITRCLGPLNGEAPTPSLATFALPANARLLLCTDGLWNYAPAPAQLAALAALPPANADALALCRRLVDFAVAQGGRDNITVAVLRTKNS